MQFSDQLNFLLLFFLCSIFKHAPSKQPTTIFAFSIYFDLIKRTKRCEIFSLERQIALSSQNLNLLFLKVARAMESRFF